MQMRVQESEHEKEVRRRGRRKVGGQGKEAFLMWTRTVLGLCCNSRGDAGFLSVDWPRGERQNGVENQ